MCRKPGESKECEGNIDGGEQKRQTEGVGRAATDKMGQERWGRQNGQPGTRRGRTVWDKMEMGSQGQDGGQHIGTVRIMKEESSIEQDEKRAGKIHCR